jgi:FtsZ-binding cell division protein ZapB
MNDANAPGYVHTIQPVTNEPAFNPEDEMQIRSIFQQACDTVVNASHLAKEITELRETLNTLRVDVEALRRTNHYLNEEVTDLRQKRGELMQENHRLREALNTAEENSRRMDEIHNHDMETINATVADRDATRITLSNTYKERDDAQLRVLELEDRVKHLEEAERVLTERSHMAEDKLTSIRSVLATALG